MDRVLPVLILAVLTATVLCLMWWSWRRRRGAGALLRADDPFDISRAEGIIDGLYVATTQSEHHLERVFAPGLTYRAAVTLVVTAEGVCIQPHGESDTYLRWDRVTGIGRSQVTIDRVVETGGLTRLEWVISRGDARLPVCSFFRLSEADHRSLTSAVRHARESKESTSP